MNIGEKNNENLSFLWLELSNACNLECIHCSTTSDRKSGTKDVLDKSDYIRVMKEAREVGCKEIQFVGGEPTLNKDLVELIAKADEMGFEFIELYSNLTRMNDKLLDSIKSHHVSVATSLYANVPDVHNLITTGNTSFDRTIKNIKVLVSENIDVRVSVIEMEANRDYIESTLEFVESLGAYAGYDKIRNVGRANASGEELDVNELCGSCGDGTLRIASDGSVTPCVMSADWKIGSVLNNSVKDIVVGKELLGARAKINHSMGSCTPTRPHRCGPDNGDFCTPCSPKGHCGPNDCAPKRRIDQVH